MAEPLESGATCLRHECSLCCYRTDMPLTYLDLNRIIKLGYRVNDFAEKSCGYWRIRNIEGKCFFLSDNLCQIYKYRPYGCRLYPLIFDLEKRKAKLDESCSYRLEFKVTLGDIRKLMFMLKTLDKMAPISF